MDIILFAQLAERLGSKKLSVPDMADTDTLTAYLKTGFAGFEQEVFLMAVDKDIIHENTALNKHSEVALMPPYSGG